MPFCPKYEIAFGSDKNAKNEFCLAADAIRKVVEKTVGENVFLFQARGHFRTVGPTHDLDMFPACRSGVSFVFQIHLKTHRFRRPGPARNRCVSGLGRDVFFGGRSRERSVLDRFCSESIETKSVFGQNKKNVGVKETPTVTYRPVARNDVFCTCVRK